MDAKRPYRPPFTGNELASTGAAMFRANGLFHCRQHAWRGSSPCSDDHTAKALVANASLPFAAAADRSPWKAGEGRGAADKRGKQSGGAVDPWRGGMVRFSTCARPTTTPDSADRNSNGSKQSEPRALGCISARSLPNAQETPGRKSPTRATIDASNRSKACKQNLRARHDGKARLIEIEGPARSSSHVRRRPVRTHAGRTAVDLKPSPTARPWDWSASPGLRESGSLRVSPRAEWRTRRRVVPSFVEVDPLRNIKLAAGCHGTLGRT